MAILLRWTFPVHINHIPETVKSVDYAGEQENKKLKIQGGLVGTTRPENSVNIFLNIACDFRDWERP